MAGPKLRSELGTAARPGPAVLFARQSWALLRKNLLIRCAAGPPAPAVVKPASQATQGASSCHLLPVTGAAQAAVMEAEPAARVPVHCRCVPYLGHRPGGHLLQLPVHGSSRSSEPRSKGHPADPRLPQRPLPAGEADAPLVKAGRQGVTGRHTGRHLCTPAVPLAVV